MKMAVSTHLSFVFGGYGFHVSLLHSRVQPRSCFSFGLGLWLGSGSSPCLMIVCILSLVPYPSSIQELMEMVQAIKMQQTLAQSLNVPHATSCHFVKNTYHTSTFVCIWIHMSKISLWVCIVSNLSTFELRYPELSWLQTRPRCGAAMTATRPPLSPESLDDTRRLP